MDRPQATRLGSKDMKLALLTEIAAPFRIPLFNALAAEEGVELRVLFLAAADPRRTHYDLHADEFRFDWRVLPGRELRRGARWVVVNRGVLRELRRFGPDVVGVGGWNQPAFWQALAYTKARRIPLLVWVESTARDARSQALPLELAKRALIRGASGFFVPGRASVEYLRGLGVSPERIAVAPNAVDAELFGAAAGPRDGKECTFLYVGRLDPEKGVDVLLRAFERVPGELVIIGGGTEEAALRTQASERVHFIGQLDRDELVPHYAAADVFVLPSRSEPWGMVLNEAAAAGLPLVATDGVGAAHELIEDGVNGFRVPEGNADALAEALGRLAADEGFRRRAGTRSRELVRPFTPEAWAKGVVELARRYSA
jgi:glycosyltransferase involved in cell wall biosynthesis